MRMVRVSHRVGIAAVLVASLIVLASEAGFAQGDPLVGTWVLNVAKSKYSPGPPPKEQTTIFEAAGQGLKVSTTGIDSAGKPTLTTYTANFTTQYYLTTAVSPAGAGNISPASGWYNSESVVTVSATANSTRPFSGYGLGQTHQRQHR